MILYLIIFFIIYIILFSIIKSEHFTCFKCPDKQITCLNKKKSTIKCIKKNEFTKNIDTKKKIEYKSKINKKIKCPIKINDCFKKKFIGKCGLCISNNSSICRPGNKNGPFIHKCEQGWKYLHKNSKNNENVFGWSNKIPIDLSNKYVIKCKYGPACYKNVNLK